MGYRESSKTANLVSSVSKGPGEWLRIQFSDRILVHPFKRPWVQFSVPQKKETRKQAKPLIKEGGLWEDRKNVVIYCIDSNPFTFVKFTSWLLADIYLFSSQILNWL